MSDLYAREQAHLKGARFDVVLVDVYQRGAGRYADDICHLEGVKVVVPARSTTETVDAYIAAKLLDLQSQALGEVQDVERLTPEALTVQAQWTPRGTVDAGTFSTALAQAYAAHEAGIKEAEAESTAKAVEEPVAVKAVEEQA